MGQGLIILLVLGAVALVIVLAAVMMKRRAAGVPVAAPSAKAVAPATPLPEPPVSPQEIEALERSKVIIHGLMLSVSESVEAFTGDVANYSTALDAHKAAIKKAMTLAAIKEVERVMLEEVESMRKLSGQYRTQLESAQVTIQRQREEMQRLSADATLDFLTKIPNRRTLDKRLSEEFARFKRYNTVFSLAMLDVDHFKRVNDTLGHIAGDRILRAVATIAQEQKRETDFLGRYGGEELALLLPETELPQARMVAEKLRKKLEGSRFNYEGTSVHVTLSAGVAQVQTTDKEVAEAVARADAALYRAKESGRNRVET